MQRLLVHLLGRRQLDQPAGIQDGDPVRDVADHRQVVGDEEIGEPELLLEILEQVDDLGPNRAPRRRSTRPASRSTTSTCWEFNEAFSSVGLNSMNVLGLTPENVNVNGGAVALGHPLGMSGARIIGSLVLELGRRGGGLGVAAICSGGGQGDAIIVRVAG